MLQDRQDAYKVTCYLTRAFDTAVSSLSSRLNPYFISPIEPSLTSVSPVSGSGLISHFQVVVYWCIFPVCLGAIQVLRNADGGGVVSDFLEKSVTKV